jgi:hypothetical protein
MKPKTIFLLCLLSGIVFTQLYSRDIPVPKNDKGTGAVSFDWVWNDWAVYGYCNGEYVDFLTGNITGHVVLIYKNWEYKIQNSVWRGEVQSSKYPYEVFQVTEIDKNRFNTLSTDRFYHCRGNYGTQYIGHVTYDWITGIYTIDKAVFVEPNKK